MIYIKKLGLFLFLVTIQYFVVAQDNTIDTTTADGLFKTARKEAFDKKNYPLAKYYCKKALTGSPKYSDIRIFLGRMYAWTDQYDSARQCFDLVLSYDSSYEDNYLAYCDLEYWDDKNEKSLLLAEAGLRYAKESNELLMRKAKALMGLKKYREASATANKILAKDKNNVAARALANRIKDANMKNKIGISYDYVYFDEQFKDPWHLTSLDYGRSVDGFGSVIARVNYANRFKNSGTQFEIDAYPSLGKKIYSYVSLGYSNDVGIFPQWRGGLSIYANLPKSFEAEMGVRYLKFTGKPTYIYTAYVGKYYKSWLFSLRTFITPSDFSNQISHSYQANARYYLGGADDLIGLTGSYGFSPDDRAITQILNTVYRMTSYRGALFYKKTFKRVNVASLDLSWANNEYLPKQYTNQITVGIAWLRRF